MPNNNNNQNVNTYADGHDESGMLSSSHIEYYIEKYGIIENYDKSCLGPASYHMRIGGDVLTWDKGKKKEFSLGEEEDKNKNIHTSIELKPNSLTFITTIEKFKLTKDIICRFNLKSKWVHQGLLLGTGPIVDPQLHAFLLIPIHNFSSQPLTVHYGDELISVEFTKTLNPDKQLDLPGGGKTKYIENENWDFDFKKYRKRIGEKPVESSVLSQFQAYDEAIRLYEKNIKAITEENEKTVKNLEDKNAETLNRHTRFNFIGLIAAILGAAVLVFTSWQVIESAHKKIDVANNLIKQYEEGSVDFRSFASKSTYNDLQKKFLELKRYTERLNSESYLKSNKIKVDLKEMRDKYEKKIRSLELKINELNKKVNNQAEIEASKQ